MPSNDIKVGNKHLCGEIVIIKTLSGKKIYQSEQRTIRGALEEGIEKGIDFSFADLRKAKLYRASLDGMVAVGAILWGADLEGADIGLADLRKSDMRCANLKDTCLAESDLTGADMRGAYFAQTILEGAILNRARVSCPSFWDQDIGSAASLRGTVFVHKGETDIAVDQQSFLIRGQGPQIVLTGNACLWRGHVFGSGYADLPETLRSAIKNVRDRLDGVLASSGSHNANETNPKRWHPAKAT